jgi:hypothetical protein
MLWTHTERSLGEQRYVIDETVATGTPVETVGHGCAVLKLVC